MIECADVMFSMELVKEQSIFVKFCFNVGKRAVETHMLREAYGNDTFSQTMTYVWFKRFKNGRTSSVANVQLQDPNL
jgi:hypothetical protein